MGITILLVLVSYLIGSCSAAIVTCKILGLPDPRTQGSQNPGATNVLRIGGKKAAFFTLAGDMLKGVLPVVVAKFVLKTDTLTIGLVALVAFLGHLYPLFFKFRGGKGVATAIGVLFPLSWLLGLGFVFTWFVVAALFRFSSLAAIVAAFLAPFYTFWLAPPYLIYVSAMSLFLIWRHRENIIRLWQGREGKIKF